MHSTDENNITQWISAHEEIFIETLSRFVSIPSVVRIGEKGLPYGQACSDALAFISEEMAEIKLGIDNVDKHVVIGTMAGSGGKKHIGIALHADVVPPEGTWDKDPFTLWRCGDWLVGRGVTDNKGPGIAVLFALRYLFEHNIKLRNKLSLYFGSAEEAGMDDMDYLKTQRPMPDFALVPDAGFPVCNGEKGCIRFKASISIKDSNLIDFHAGVNGNSVAAEAEASVRYGNTDVLRVLNNFEGISASCSGGIVRISSAGRARHTAFPDEGIDAIGRLARALDAADILEGPAKKAVRFIGRSTSDFHGAGLGISMEDDVSGKLTHVLPLIRAGDDYITIMYNIRYPISADPERLEERIHSRICGEGFRIYDFVLSPACYTPVTPLINGLCRIANTIMETEDTPYTMGGSTYARKFPRAVAYGMGVPSRMLQPPFPAGQGRAHQPNESVYLPRLLKGIHIYIKAILAADKHLEEE
ncbi:Sapep family Mn(2+)-dependent dipeptidase [Treponema sp. OttesenSCG-928-L16]|nr:Sapep family Mn(2+)-dependent dipeptidase [Treponema sp. OttesenSCG-928-L16]